MPPEAMSAWNWILLLGVTGLLAAMLGAIGYLAAGSDRRL